MQTYAQTLGANEALRLGVPGRYFRILTATLDVDVTFYNRGMPVMQALQVGAGMWAKPAGGFDRVDVQNGATGQTVKIAISAGDAGQDSANLSVTGAVEITNDIGAPIPVSGTVAVSAVAGTVATVETLATAIAHPAAVSVGVAATALLAAVARRCVEFYNDGTDTVYLGGATVTTANAAIRIAPGQSYFNDIAPGAAWYGISATAAQSVRIQTYS